MQEARLQSLLESLQKNLRDLNLWEVGELIDEIDEAIEAAEGPGMQDYLKMQFTNVARYYNHRVNWKAFTTKPRLHRKSATTE